MFASLSHVQISQLKEPGKGRNTRFTCTRCGKTEPIDDAADLAEVERLFRIFEVDHISCPEGYWYGQDRRQG